MLDDLEMIRRVRNGDQAAWKELYEKYFPVVWRHTYLRIQQRQVAEDITSDAFLGLVQCIRQGTELQSVAGWLFTFANRRLADRVRERINAERQRQLVRPTDVQKETADEALLRTELRFQVLAALDQLPDKLRLALEWKYIDKLSVTEIAERLEQTEKSVESLLYRGRKTFRALIAADDEREALKQEKSV